MLNKWWWYCKLWKNAEKNLNMNSYFFKAFKAIKISDVLDGGGGGDGGGDGDGGGGGDGDDDDVV